MNAIAAIDTHALTKRYGEKTAVSALDLQVAQGELFALLGVNGAGKTTTIKMLSCLLAPSSGDASLLGRSILRDTQAAKQILNISPQETAVARNLTVRENLVFIARIYGASGEDAARKAQEMIDALSLREVEKSRAKTLSGGMQRRLSIAMALITDPQILFLDEPTLGLDVLARRELWSIVEGLKCRITIMLTTHYMEEAEALSDRIGIMANGALLATGTAQSLIERTGAKNFEDAFISIATEGGAIQ